MSKFLSEKLSSLTPYTPGEQPRGREYNKLNTNESPFPPSPVAQRMARQAAGDLELYSDPTCKDLISVAAEVFGVNEDEIIFSNGSDEVLNFAFMAFCDKDCPAVFPDITYGFYPVFAALNGVPYSEIPLCEDFTVNVKDYTGTKKTVFLANPNAPTGIALSLAEIEKIVKGNPENVVVIDEAYVDFGAESAVCLTKKYSNLLVVGTFSKSRSLAGGRLGFAIGCKDLIQDLNTIKYSTNPYNVNRMTMAAGIGALIDKDYFKSNCEKIISLREKYSLILKEMGFLLTNSKANFIFAKHPKTGGKELYLFLKENGVLVRHFDKDRIKDYVRITVGNEEQMDDLIEKLKSASEVLL